MQLNREDLLKAYTRMRTIREFEERVHKEFATGKIPGFVHLYAGEETSAVGVCMQLNGADYITSTHRGHGHCIGKGCDVDGMMKEIFGREGGLCKGKGGSMHIADVGKGMLGANGIVGGGPPLACGAALAAKERKTGGVAVAFFGDGAFNQGTTLESMNLASVYKLPVFFVLEDNGYAETTSSKWSIGGHNPVRRAEGFGIPGERVDGHDFFAVYRCAKEAVRADARGRRPAVPAHRVHPLLRTLRRRRDDLSAARRGERGTQFPRLPELLPRARDRRRSCSRRALSIASTRTSRSRSTQR